MWQNQIWIQSFKFVFARFSDSTPKPMKQLLGTLISVLQKDLANPMATASHAWLCSELSSVFGLPAGSAPSKAHLHTLTTTLVKNVVRLEQVTPQTIPDEDPLAQQTTQLEVLGWSKHSELGPSLASLIDAVVSSARGFGPSSWFQSLVVAYEDDVAVKTAYRHYILPAVFSKDSGALFNFLAMLNFENSIGLDGDENSIKELAISTLMVASSAGKLHIDPESNEIAPKFDGQHLILPIAWLRRLSMSQSKLARIASLSILVGETTTVEPFHNSVLKLFLHKLPIMFADTDADFRSDLLSIIQRIIDRIRASGSALMRKNDSRLARLTEFVNQWFHTLVRELRPSASYQRHACALSCIKMLMKSGMDWSIAAKFWSKSAKTSGTSKFRLTLFSDSIRPVLLSLLLDPFDDIRGLSTSTLEALAGSNEHSEPLHREVIAFLRSTAQQSVQSSRADLTDGIARAYALLYAAAPEANIAGKAEWNQSKSTIFTSLTDTFSQSARPNRHEADEEIVKHPLHYAVIALRYIVESQATNFEGDHCATSAHGRLMPAISSTWTMVRHILCNDAPEGYTPGEDEDAEMDLDTKSLLSFCWRAIKETSLLQRALIMSFAICKDRNRAIHHLREHLELSFTQLIELRHRGAFSTVAQTFAACCTQIAKIDPDGEAVVQSFYRRGLDSIQNTSTINTRRSAGLPAVIAGVLSSTTSSTAFHSAIVDLTQIAKDPPSLPIRDHQALPQVHALNCLREVFKSSKLGLRSEQYIPQSLLLAGQCLSSSLWGIRNSGLILFRSLIDRLLGTNDSYEDDLTRAKAKDVLVRYPELLTLALTLLDVDINAGATQSMEKVFPALQILQRVSVPPQDRDEVGNAVATLTSSEHWHVRQKAASTYARLQQERDILAEFQKCLLWDVRSECAQHGRLLCLWHLVKQRQNLPSHACTSLLNSATIILDRCYEQNSSEIVVSIALDIRDHLLYQMRNHSNGSTFSIPNFASGDPEWVSHMIESRTERSQPSQSSLMTRSLAVTLLSEMASMDSWRANASILATSDRDACVALLERAFEMCRSQKASEDELAVLGSITTDLLDTGSQDTPINVRKSAMRLLSTVLEREAPLSQSIRLPSASQILHIGESPLLHDDALILSAMLLARKFQQASISSSEVELSLQVLTSYLIEAAREDKPFDTRLASAVAVTKLHSIFSTLRRMPQATVLLIDLVTLVYDLTNDDDDEIRDIAASLASRILINESNGVQAPIVVPLEAGPAMLARLVSARGQEPHLAELSLSRLTTTMTDPGASPLVPVSVVLDTALANNTALFAREKQNLFIDPAREARIWSKIAAKVPAHITTITKLQRWTIDGVVALAERPLALASFEGFSIALAVVYAAEVLLQFARNGAEGVIKPTAVRAALASLLDAGRQTTALPMLLEEAERVLEEDLRRGMEKVGSVLSGLGLTI